MDKVKFEKVIKDAVKARKERLEERRNLLVEMRPEFALAFNECMRFSRKENLAPLFNLVENGRASNLMKSSAKRKRTWEELEEVK